jgi:hypothetical protein
VRLWNLLCLEVLAFTGAALGLIEGARALSPRPSGPAGLVAARAPVYVPDELLVSGVADSATGTFLGMSDELLLGRMQKSTVKALHFNRGGSSISFRVDFVDGSRAAFKPVQTNPQSVPRKEVAAYRLGRLLGLHQIAPSVLRPLTRDEVLGKLAPDSEWTRTRITNETIFDSEGGKGKTLGALMYWIPNIIDLHLDTTDGIERWTEWLGQPPAGQPAVRIPPDKVGLMAQLSTLLLFDLLQNNADRFSGGNLVGSPDGRTLYFMDNAFGFQADAEGHQHCWSYLKRAQKFSRSFFLALHELERAQLVVALNEETTGPLLTSDEIDALLGRRDRALRYLRGLFAEYGEDKVLVFP